MSEKEPQSRTDDFAIMSREVQHVVAEVWEWTPKQMQRRIDRLEREHESNE